MLWPLCNCLFIVSEDYKSLSWFTLTTIVYKVTLVQRPQTPWALSLIPRRRLYTPGVTDKLSEMYTSSGVSYMQSDWRFCSYKLNDEVIAARHNKVDELGYIRPIFQRFAQNIVTFDDEDWVSGKSLIDDRLNTRKTWPFLLGSL